MDEPRAASHPAPPVPAERLRADFADTLVASGRLEDEALATAFRDVPRHLFLPDVPIEAAYTDRAFDLRRGDAGLTSSSTPPSMMAIMLEQLGVQPGHRVLEIGTGSGYNAALLARLTGPDGHVTSVECDVSLVEPARARLAEAGHRRVAVIPGDGADGEASGAPYHRIIVTACAGDIAPAWWDQLAEGGRIVVPLALRQTQTSIGFERFGDRLDSLSAACCSFVHLRRDGSRADSWTRRVPLDAVAGVVVEATAETVIDVDWLTDALLEPRADRATGVVITVGDYLFGLRLWLELEEPRFSWLAAGADGLGAILVPPLVRLGGAVSTGFVHDEADGVAALVAPPGTDPAMSDVHAVNGSMTPFELHVRPCGERDAAADRLVQLVRGWEAAGRPFRGTSDALKVHACRRPAPPPAARLAVDRDCSRFAIDW